MLLPRRLIRLLLVRGLLGGSLLLPCGLLGIVRVGVVSATGRLFCGGLGIGRLLTVRLLRVRL